MKKYIAGIITGIMLLPIMDSLTEIAQVALEIPKGFLSKKVLMINKDLQELNSETGGELSPCIGFQVSSPEEEYYDE